MATDTRPGSTRAALPGRTLASDERGPHGLADGPRGARRGADARGLPAPSRVAPAGPCRGVGADAFVASHRGTSHSRELCEGCPVRAECLEVPLADPTLLGLWGETSWTERKVMRRGRVA